MSLKREIRKGLRALGLPTKLDHEVPELKRMIDIARDYKDPEGVVPNFRLKKMPRTPASMVAAEFTVFNGKDTIKEVVLYSHLTLLKMCKEYEFDTVLDIGSAAGQCSRIFKHIGKKVTTVEIAPGFEADYRGDYLEHKFDKPFDAIWCSQIYEHQRNPGIFLDKVFDELKEGGVLGLTVPVQLDENLGFGHINLTTPVMLIYHLVCAGFDCSEIALKVYNANIGVVLKKKYNGIKRGLAFGSLPLHGTSKETKELLGDEIFEGMQKSFPFPVSYPLVTKKIRSINWEGAL